MLEVKSEKLNQKWSQNSERFFIKQETKITNIEFFLIQTLKNLF